LEKKKDDVSNTINISHNDRNKITFETEKQKRNSSLKSQGGNEGSEAGDMNPRPRGHLAS